MEHIVQFAVGIDDKGIKERIEKSAEKQILEHLYDDIIVTLGSGWVPNNMSYKAQGAMNQLSNELAKKVAETIIANYKNEIIEKAATILADRLFRTKAAKELLRNTNEVKEK